MLGVESKDGLVYLHFRPPRRTISLTVEQAFDLASSLDTAADVAKRAPDPELIGLQFSLKVTSCDGKVRLYQRIPEPTLVMRSNTAKDIADLLRWKATQAIDNLDLRFVSLTKE